MTFNDFFCKNYSFLRCVWISAILLFYPTKFCPFFWASSNHCHIFSWYWWVPDYSSNQQLFLKKITLLMHYSFITYLKVLHSWISLSISHLNYHFGYIGAVSLCFFPGKLTLLGIDLAFTSSTGVFLRPCEVLIVCLYSFVLFSPFLWFRQVPITYLMLTRGVKFTFSFCFFLMFSHYYGLNVTQNSYGYSLWCIKCNIIHNFVIGSYFHNRFLESCSMSHLHL